jgi:hypothetical protein
MDQMRATGGFYVVPSTVISCWQKALSQSAMAVLHYVMRYTLGWRRLSACISYGQFLEGTVRLGVRQDAGCGITSRSTLQKAIREVVGHGLMRVDNLSDVHHRGLMSNRYTLLPALWGAAGSETPWIGDRSTLDRNSIYPRSEIDLPWIENRSTLDRNLDRSLHMDQTHDRKQQQGPVPEPEAVPGVVVVPRSTNDDEGTADDSPLDAEAPKASEARGAQEAPAPTVDLVEQMVALGVTASRAVKLAGSFEPEQIARQLEALPYRRCDDPAAAFIKSLTEQWALPRRMVDAQRQAATEEIRRREEDERRQLQAAAAARCEAEKDARAAATRYLDRLDPAARAALDAEALEVLRIEAPELAERESLARRAFLASVRTNIILRRLGVEARV